jgi:hypothetical protein
MEDVARTVQDAIMSPALFCLCTLHIQISDTMMKFHVFLFGDAIPTKRQYLILAINIANPGSMGSIAGIQIQTPDPG